jgi:membrane protease YdiL (CAAX protease family)
MAFSSAASRIWLYLGLTLVFSSVFYALIIVNGHLSGGAGMFTSGLMWCPALAALVTCRISGLGLSSLGWSWQPWRYQRLAYLLPLGYAAAAYLIVWVCGLGDVPNREFLAKIDKMFALPGAPTWLTTTLYVLLAASVGVVRSLAVALGEEIGWRGFLTPHMNQVFGFTGGALLTGVIWTTWHLPILLFADYNAGTPWWFAMTCFAVMVISISIPMAWIRLRSGSLWTAAIIHAAHNLFVQAVFTPMTAPHGWITPYAIDEFGFVLPLVAVVVAIWFWRRRGELTQMPA